MRRLFLLLVCLLSTTGAQAPAQENGAGPDVPKVLAVENTPSDQAIADRLRAIVSALDHDEITVSVDAGVVTLAGDIADPADSRDVAGIAERLEGVVAVNNELAASDDLSRQINPAFKRFRARTDQFIARLPLLFLAVAAFAAIVAVGILLSRLRFWDRIAPNAFIAAIYRQAFRVACGIVGIVVALDLLGAAALLGTILGAAGIVGLAIGFAVRDTVENFVASIMLSLRQPFLPNDLIEIEGDVGRVIRLTSRATILLSLDGNHIRIPNASVFKGRIVNYTQNPARRFSFDIGIDPDAGLEATRVLAQEALKAQPFVLDDPEELVWIENITESGAILRVTGWIDQDQTGFVTARGDAIRLVKAAIEAAGVAIPDTTYRIRLEGSGKLSDVPARSHPREKSAPPSAPEQTTQPDRKSEEEALIPLVAAERREIGDLLTKDAPRE
ncbi:mechanosensitive ion channel domain-containing protein [Tropicimonas isoalkanivorans]|uniref:Small-conductance mechanosensitive channel n=1 Tax=Tropicimonas isoalkanivorans TaxID=441112 RepID=A0A1I1R4M6_9RHOB|nr:mechanosensitive ion channel domain-containing protein [Tropicimonas isoalkanivorans]SFD25240.1 Small-conductance mechanosensitive channel [Tropicimonas isoalkanivorans]